MVFPSNFLNTTIIWQFFRVILNFVQECYYLKNKEGVVGFTKALGLGVCKIYYSHYIFEVMYHCVGRGVEVIAQPFLPFLTGMLEKTFHQKKFYTGGPTLIIFHLRKTKISRETEAASVWSHDGGKEILKPNHLFWRFSPWGQFWERILHKLT